MPWPAVAQVAGTVGESVTGLRGAARAIQPVLVGAIFIAGVIMLGSGLMRLSAIGMARGEPDRSDVLAAMLRLAGGTLLVGLPTFLMMTQTTVFNRDVVMWSEPGAGSVNRCVGAGGNLLCVVRNLENNLVGIVLDFVNLLAILIAIWFAYTAVRALVRGADGSHAGQVNPWVRLLLAAAFANFPIFITNLATTLGAPPNMGIGAVGELIRTNDMLLYNVIGGQSMAAESASRLFAALLSLLAAFGVIAVFRGLWMFKRAAEQAADGATGAGFTHVIGGTLLINMQWTICIVSRTVFGQDWGFCG